MIYAGTGETTIRTDVSYGDGIYRSTDGGKTWKHLGLEETRHIGEIRIHPQDPDLVHVAALGHAFGPNPERGVYRSRDGGANWEHVLFQSPRAGAVDLAMDATNPRILFATFWQTHRHFWELSSGGPDSTIYRSTDGGDTWTDIGRNRGLPKGILGKIGITVSPARPQRVWAIIEAEKGGVYRSDDGGDTWDRLNGSRDLLNRPWYYLHIFADPQDPETVWVTNLSTWKSTDGGRNFSRVSTPHGDDHDMWFDPADPQRMIQGNDGGACVSFNGGKTWSTIYNQPTAQIYRIDTDNRFPYRIYGTQQDNSSIAVPSATEYGAIPWGMCHAAGTGGERIHRGASGRSRYRLRGSRGQLPRGRSSVAALRSEDPPDPPRDGLARRGFRPAAGRSEIPVQLDLPHPVLSPRPPVSCMPPGIGSSAAGTREPVGSS